MIGNVIGNYRIEREIGEGGMSHVYVGRTIARNEVLPENYAVVLKIMSEELAGEVTARKRFVKEAQILEKLRHRNITRFYEFINNKDNAVLVMEFVEGKPVDLILAEKGSMPIPDAISIAQSMLEALVYAHGKGIVHRDIKPANLIRETAGAVKVTDFGMSALRAEIDKELEAIVLKAMHPKMEGRFEGAREFFEALEEYNLRPMNTPTMRPRPAVGAQSATPAWLLVNVKPEINEKHTLKGDSVMVGRDRSCAIVLAHPAVSRRHARITLSGTSYVVEDLKSANGTYVNNTRVDRAKLKPGDVVRFGADPACSYVVRDR